MKKNRQFSLLISLCLIVISLSTTIFTSSIDKKKTIVNQAATSLGSEQIIISNSTTSFKVGQTASVPIYGVFTNKKIDGIQFVINMSGSIPRDLIFNPKDIYQMQIAKSKLVQNQTSAQLQVAYITNEPSVPYLAYQMLQLGTLSFTVPSSGQMSLIFDTKLTKVIQNTTHDDILFTPHNLTLTFIGQPTPTPVPPLYCPGPNGTSCEITVCPTCTSRICPKQACKIQMGVCRNNVCTTSSTKKLPKY